MNSISRAHFLKTLVAGAAVLPGITAAGAVLNELRGDRVGWARLKTPSNHWMRHSTGDPVLMQFLREHTTLNIDPNWYVADIERLEQLQRYPLLFSQGVHMVRSAASRSNLAEYVRRGGFLLIDACCNPDINGMTHDTFFQREQEFLGTVLREARIVPLPADHAIYRCCFKFPEGRPPHTFFNNVFDARKAGFGLYGIQIADSTVGLISLSGLQCGWDKMIAPPGHDVLCMKMLVNIYVYAMTQRG